MTLPLWYVRAVTGMVGIVGLIGVFLLCLLASAALIDRMTHLFGLHECFIDFMCKWIRERHKQLEEARDHNRET